MPEGDGTTKRRVRAVEGLLGVALVFVALSFYDWRAGVAAAGLLLYISAAWGRA